MGLRTFENRLQPPNLPMPMARNKIFYCRGRARTDAVCRKPCFQDLPHAHRSVHARGVPAYRVRSWGQYLVPRVVGAHWSNPAGNWTRQGGRCARAWTRDGPGVAISFRCAEPGMRGHLGKKFDGPAPPWVGSRSPYGWDQIPYRPGGWVLHQPPWSFGFDSQTRGTRENRRTLC